MQAQELVTKEDLKHGVELLRRDMHDMEQRLIIKLGGLMALSIGIVAALVKLLQGFIPVYRLSPPA